MYQNLQQMEFLRAIATQFRHITGTKESEDDLLKATLERVRFK